MTNRRPRARTRRSDYGKRHQLDRLALHRLENRLGECTGTYSHDADGRERRKERTISLLVRCLWRRSVEKRIPLVHPLRPAARAGQWSIAVHRNNVRTNGGAVFETSYTRIDQLPESSEAFADMPFTEDIWTENEVWDSQTQMLQSLVPSQGIKVNRVLSSWLTMRIPPMPPQFVHNNHVFILRLNDGTYAALQLEDYLSPTGTKCYLTINYKYPY